MSSFSSLTEKTRKIKELYEKASRREDLTRWEDNFLKSIELVLEGKRVMTPMMMATLNKIVKKKKSDGRTIVRNDDGDMDSEPLFDDPMDIFDDIF